MSSSPEITQPLEVTLPPAIYATTGIETSIYFASLINRASLEGLTFQSDCAVGSSDDERWSITPSVFQFGSHVLKISAEDSATGQRVEVETVVRVSPPVSVNEDRLKLLMVGDSLTHASIYPHEVQQQLLRAGSAEPILFGSHRPEGAADGIAHEGYGGWTWKDFLHHYDLETVPPRHRSTSPFVYKNGEGSVGLDADRYFNDFYEGEKPDFITCFLGINDLFESDHNQPALDARIEEVFAEAEQILEALRATASEAQIGLLLTPFANSREASFENVYADKSRFWRWMLIRHRLVQKQIEYFGGREAENIYIVPTTSLDPVDGYPEGDAVHPNEKGYRQLGTDVYNWLNWRLHSQTVDR